MRQKFQYGFEDEIKVLLFGPEWYYKMWGSHGGVYAYYGRFGYDTM